MPEPQPLAILGPYDPRGLTPFAAIGGPARVMGMYPELWELFKPVPAAYLREFTVVCVCGAEKPVPVLGALEWCDCERVFFGGKRGVWAARLPDEPEEQAA